MGLLGFMVFLTGMVVSPEVKAQNMDFLSRMVNDEDEVFLVKGDLTTIAVQSPTRISIVAPEVADIVEANDNEILLIGKAAGETPLFIWEEEKKRVVMIRVVEKNLEDRSAARKTF